VLQADQVRPQLLFVMQVDVERADVEERKVEELGGRIVDVGEQAVGCRGLRVIVQAMQEPFDTPAPCQRTTAAGISLPSAKRSTAG
jgi:hypothetical protein